MTEELRPDLHPAVAGHEVAALAESEAVSLVFTKVTALCNYKIIH